MIDLPEQPVIATRTLRQSETSGRRNQRPLALYAYLAIHCEDFTLGFAYFRAEGNGIAFGANPPSFDPIVRCKASCGVSKTKLGISGGSTGRFLLRRKLTRGASDRNLHKCRGTAHTALR